MRGHDLTTKKHNDKDMTKTNTFGELHQKAILETSNPWDIWSELWRDMKWPKKDNDKDKDKDKKNSDNDKLLSCGIWDSDYN